MAKNKEYIVTFKVLAKDEESAVDQVSKRLVISGEPDSISLYVETFGEVSWCDEDIKEALKRGKKKVTRANIDKIRDSFEARHIGDTMTEHGWEILSFAVENV